MGLFSRSTVALLLTVVLAGCAAGGAEPDSVQPSLSVDPGGDTGGIEGSVVDDSLTPVGAAQVAVTTSTGVFQALTGETGGFMITGVPAGRHTLFAAALGYDSVAKSVEVIAGQVTTVSLSLSPLPVIEPYVELFGPYDGYFECRIGHANTGECGWFIAQQPHPTQLYPNDRSIFSFNMTSEDWQTFQGEMRWQQGSFATSTSMRLAFSYDGRTGVHRWCSSEGPSPLVWRYERAGIEESLCTEVGNNEEAPEPEMKYNPLRTYANVPFGANADPQGLVYVSFQQRFQVVVSVFYGERAPVDYSAFPDA